MIPYSGLIVAAKYKALADVPAVLGDYEMVIAEETTDEQLEDICKKLMQVERGTSVRLHFYFGDWYNALAKKRGHKNEVLRRIYLDCGSKYEQLLKTYGWVARKWPVSWRSDEHPWSYYVKWYLDANDVPTEHKKRGGEDKPTMLEVSSEKREPNGDVVLYLRSSASKQFVARLPAKREHVVYSYDPPLDGTEGEEDEFAERERVSTG